MNPINLDEALARAIDPVFGQEIISQTFRSVFQEYPIDILEELDDDKLDIALRSISSREDVQFSQLWIDELVQGGERTLDTIVADIIISSLPKSGIITQEEMFRMNEYAFQELWLHSSSDDHRIAMGYFPLSTTLDDAVFTPENVIYQGGLKWGSEAGGRPALIHEEAYVRRAAKTFIFNQIPNQERARMVVKKVIENAAKKMPIVRGRDKTKKGWNFYRRRVTQELYRHFLDVLDQKGEANYSELYKVFELARRKNINLSEYLGANDLIEFTGFLLKEIGMQIPLPKVIVRTRVKQLDRAYEKIIEAMYDIKTEGYIGDYKKFEDMYGLRVVLPEVKDITSFVKNLKKNKSIEIVSGSEKNYTGKGRKPNEYQSFHIGFRCAGYLYDLQVRTHEMDRMAETAPKQSHEGDFIALKRELIETVPVQVRRAVGTVLGIYHPIQKAD